MLKCTFRVCGTHPSILEGETAQDHQIGEPKQTETAVGISSKISQTNVVRSGGPLRAELVECAVRKWKIVRMCFICVTPRRDLVGSEHVITRALVKMRSGWDANAWPEALPRRSRMCSMRASTSVEIAAHCSDCNASSWSASTHCGIFPSSFWSRRAIAGAQGRLRGDRDFHRNFRQSCTLPTWWNPPRVRFRGLDEGVEGREPSGPLSDTSDKSFPMPIDHCHQVVTVKCFTFLSGYEPKRWSH
jgi:hypothetical protein